MTREIWTGSHAVENSTSVGGSTDSIRILTWNIEWGIRVPEAVEVIADLERSGRFDVLLLQEMDERGAEQVARALGRNYVYATAGVLHRSGRHFGNTILSMWPIDDPRTHALPHPTYVRRQARMAVSAEIGLPGGSLRAFSTHLETPRIIFRHRLAQFDTLRDAIAEFGAGTASGRVVVGGDFNTVRRGAAAALEQRLDSLELGRVSPERGRTFRRFGRDFTLDHLFARGLDLADGSIESPGGASDHHPVWATLRPSLLD